MSDHGMVRRPSGAWPSHHIRSQGSAGFAGSTLGYCLGAPPGLTDHPAPSPPHVPLIPLDPMPGEEIAELVLKTTFTVMFNLTTDVGDGRVACRQADAERTVTLLPGEAPVREECAVHPGRGRRLERAHGVRQRHVRRKRDQRVDMILDPANRQRRETTVAGDAAEHGVETIAPCVSDQRLPVAGAEDDVDQAGSVGVGHGLVMVVDWLRASTSWWCLRAWSAALPGLGR